MSIEPWAAGAVVSVILAILGGYWTLARLVVAQFNRSLDERFKAMERAREVSSRSSEERVARIEDHTRELERDILRLRAELPVDYVRREDHIRYETLIGAKLDALGAQIMLLNERTMKGGE